MWFNKQKLKVRQIAFESKVQKYKYLIQQFENSSSKVSVWLYYFESTRVEVAQLCEATSTAHHAATTESLLHEGINLMDARSLDLSKIHGYDELILTENHPMHSIHDQIVKQAEQAGLKELIFYTSLDAPIMQLFGGDRLKNIMGQLGLKEAEPIEHAMVSKSIQKAQEKMEEQMTVHNDVRTSSEEWLSANPVNT